MHAILDLYNLLVKLLGYQRVGLGIRACLPLGSAVVVVVIYYVVVLCFCFDG